MSNYKILRIAEFFYKNLANDLYTNHPELKSLPYDRQLKSVLDRAYVYSDSFSKGMSMLGHDVHEIIYDLEFLQKTWARENSLSCQPSRCQTEIVLKQIEAIKPDVLYFQDTNSLSYSIRKDLKKIFPFIRVVAIYRGSSSNMAPVNDADVLFLGIPALVKRYTDAGLKPYLLYHAFDDNVLQKLENYRSEERKTQYDFTFIGTSGFGRGIVHRDRYWWLVALIENTNIQLWLNEIEPTAIGSFRYQFEYVLYKLLKLFYSTTNESIPKAILKVNSLPKKLKRLTLEILEEHRRQSIKIENSRKNLMKWPLNSLLKSYPNRCHETVFGLKMYDILRQSKITFNKHPASAFGTVGNMRMFEATGIGTCLLTDHGSNIKDLFAADEEVVAYNSFEECIEKLEYLLNHDVEREKIAQAGHKRTLKDHTYANRCQQIDEILQKIL